MHRTPSLTILGLSLAAISLVGCASGPAVKPPSGTIGGIPAPKSKVVLDRQQEVRGAINLTYVFPAGDYRPAFEDETGVYYEAPSKVIMKESFSGCICPASLSPAEYSWSGTILR